MFIVMIVLWLLVTIAFIVPMTHAQIMATTAEGKINLSKLFEVSEEYVCAIETSLGANSSVIVTEDAIVAKALIF